MARQPPQTWFGDPLVEGAALLPEAVVPLVVPVREERAFAVQVVAGLRQDGHALLRELAKAVHGLREELRVVHHLVVIQKDHGIEAEGVGDDEAQVADSAIPGQADLLGQALDVLLGHALLYERQLGSADDEGGHLGMLVADSLHLLGRLGLDGHVGRHEYHDKPEPLHLGKRLQAAPELAGLVGRRGVVVEGNHVGTAAVAARIDEGGNDDNGIHGGSFRGSGSNRVGQTDASGSP